LVDEASEGLLRALGEGYTCRARMCMDTPCMSLPAGNYSMLNAIDGLIELGMAEGGLVPHGAAAAAAAAAAGPAASAAAASAAASAAPAPAAPASVYMSTGYQNHALPFLPTPPPPRVAVQLESGGALLPGVYECSLEVGGVKGFACLTGVCVCFVCWNVLFAVCVCVCVCVCV
jgi:hypothetical protein